jgi:mitochondrial protein import protein ZIM17
MNFSCQSLLRQFSPQVIISGRITAASSASRRSYHQFFYPRPQTATSQRYGATTSPSSRFSRRRYESSLATTEESAKPPQDLQPAYQITFTCKPCRTRSAHRITKQGYHHGTTLITCPGCQKRHLISDHLKIFGESPASLEDILQKKLNNGKPLSDLLKKGKLGIRQGAIVGVEGEEDLEFWEDGTETTHEKTP